MAKTAVKSKAKRKTLKGRKIKKKVPRLRKPEDMSLEQWQVALRKQFAKEQNFRLKNIGEEPIFSEFVVTNPKTEGEYRVAIRGQKLGDNYCSCPDLAVNTLGTCKHIEFTLAKLLRKRGGKKAFEEGFHPPYSEIYLHYGPKREVIFSPGTKCPKSLLELASRYFGKQGILTQQGYSQFDTFMRKAGAIKHDLRCYDDTIDFIAQVRDQNILRQRIEKAFPGDADSVAFKKLLKVSLYPYQRSGALFAAKAGRSLLADDMGLGKTIQAIAAVEMLAKTVGIERVLIVSPTSLKYQWKQEIEKFSGRAAQVVEGSLTKRTELYGSDSFYKIVNYEVVRRDLNLINNSAPDMIILDEAQRIKNWKTQTAQAVKKLDSKYALVLTGTPLENRLEELHSIVEFIDRFHLGPLFRFIDEHQHVDEVGKVIGYRNLSKIGKSLEPILIRRTKNEVLKELPERLDKNYFVPMTDQQMQHHEENREIVARIVAKWRRFGFLSETDRRRLMIVLQNMRMSCNSTYLLDKKTDFGNKADELISVLDEVFEQPDAKVVIFSQWLRTHEIIINRLKPRKYNHVLFHGGVPSVKRKDLISQFKEDPDCRVFLSTDAGGLGLNLQNASVVINMDLPWNPAVLEQRIGRIHRLGQRKPVRVVNFVAQGTIEHGMLSLLSFKQSLFSGVLDNGQNDVFLGGTRLKRFMDSVDQATNAIPDSMPQQANVAANGDGVEPGSIIPSETKKTQEGAALNEQPFGELITMGLSFLDKLGDTLLGTEKQSSEPISKIFSEVKIETDKTTGQRHLKLPIPKKEVFAGLANLFSELSKKM
ncbi:MAG: DEAD/DEAH box helicase [candidate division Zixibacteria bacterium]|nr:DEAD/DEAH box helicase [candidate division Zixibacteria bacterium]